jgi:branched-chain amino acid transport system permease protein
MMFIVLMGCIGTLEGPILGTLIYFALREIVTVVFKLSGSWYLVGLGAVAMAAMLYAPAGLWPVLQDRLGIEWLSVRRHPPSRAAGESQVSARA